jgi:hypothetical protein
LRDPRWLAALGLLLLNDWLLKPLAAQGSFPGWLSGKLSDAAGLTVAPVLLASGLVAAGTRSRVARASAITAVALFFSVTNLSPGLAQAVDGFVGLVGIPARTWPDPTDLAALLVLPWTYAILHKPNPLELPTLQWFGAALGGIACLATSWNGPGDPLSPAIVNLTDAQIVVTAQPLTRPLDCEAVPTADQQLSLDDFGEPESVALTPTEGRELAGNFPGAEGEEVCGAALVSVGPFLPPTVVAWRTERRHNGGYSSLEHETVPEGTVFVQRVADQLLLVPGEGMFVLSAPGAAR